MFAPQSLQRFNDFLLIHLQRIGDHTRGLFEAEASIVVSAAHALQDVEIVFLSRHGLLTLSTVRLKFRGESYLLCRYRFGQGHWLSLGIYDDPEASKNPPGAIQPDRAKNNEGILDDRPGQLGTRDGDLKPRAFSRFNNDRRLEPLFNRFELPMRKLRGVQPQRILIQVFDSPNDGPRTLNVCWTHRYLAERYFRRIARAAIDFAHLRP